MQRRLRYAQLAPRLRYAQLAPLVGLLCCAVESPQGARAQSLDLSWQAPGNCPDATAMRARVDELVAGSDAATDGVRVVGRIEQRAGRWRLNLALDLRGRHAVRELEDTDCVSLGETAAWLVSVAIDPNIAPPAAVERTAAEAADADEAAVPPPSESSPPTSEAPATEAASTAPNTGSAWQLVPRLSLFGGGFAAGFAGPAVSAGVEVAVEAGPLSLALFGAHHFERSRALSAPGTQADFSSLELGLAACAQWGLALRAGPCALLSVLRTAGSTEGVTQGRDDGLWWGTAGASFAVRYRVWAQLELWLDAGLWLPISARPRFEVEPLGTAGEAATLGGRLRLGVGWRLP